LLLSQQLISFDRGALVPPLDARVHSDFYPVLEYAAQRDFFARARAERFRRLDENFMVRTESLLGQWLRQNGLSKDDLAAFAAYYLGDDSRPLDTFLTLLRRWQREQPDSPLPLELGARVKQFQPPGELDVLRLAPHRELIFARAPEEPLLLRQYGRALMRQYSEQRSVFNAPPTDELEPVLRRLIEVDPDHQRVYQAWLAELAWDRADDEQSLRWGELALAPDLPRGNARYRFDPEAPLRAAAILADLYLRRGEPARAAAFCEGVTPAGYLTDETRYNALLFEFTQRRVFLALSPAAAATE
jgi:hypothetical protein